MGYRLEVGGVGTRSLSKQREMGASPAVSPQGGPPPREEAGDPLPGRCAPAHGPAALAGHLQGTRSSWSTGLTAETVTIPSVWGRNRSRQTPCLRPVHREAEERGVSGAVWLGRGRAGQQGRAQAPAASPTPWWDAHSPGRGQRYLCEWSQAPGSPLKRNLS